MPSVRAPKVPAASSVKPKAPPVAKVLAPASSVDAAPEPIAQAAKATAPVAEVDSQATEESPDQPIIAPSKPAESTVPPSHRRPRHPPGTVLAEETQAPTPPPVARPTQRSSARRLVQLYDDDELAPPSAQPRPSAVDTPRPASPSLRRDVLTRHADPVVEDKTPLRSPPRPRTSAAPLPTTSSLRPDNIFAPAVKRSVRDEVEAKAGWHLHESTKKRLRAEAKAERKALVAAGKSIPSVGREDRFSRLGVNQGPISWSDSSSQESVAVAEGSKKRKAKRDSDVFGTEATAAPSKRAKLEPGETRPGENFMRQIHRARNAEVFADPLKWKGRGRYAETLPGCVIGHRAW